MATAVQYIEAPIEARKELYLGGTAAEESLE